MVTVGVRDLFSSKRWEALAPQPRAIGQAGLRWFLSFGLLALCLSPLAGALGGSGAVSILWTLAALETGAGIMSNRRRPADGPALGASIGVLIAGMLFYAIYAALAGITRRELLVDEGSAWLTTPVLGMLLVGFADGYSRSLGGNGLLLTIWCVLPEGLQFARLQRRRVPWWFHWRWVRTWPRTYRRSVLRLRLAVLRGFDLGGRFRTPVFLILLSLLMARAFKPAEAPELLPGWSGVLASGALFVTATVLGYGVGVGLAIPLGRAQAEFNHIEPYILTAVKPVVGFAMGYLWILFLFTGWFWWIFQKDARAFESTIGVENLGFPEFVYVSSTSLITVGYGGSTIVPKSPLAQAVVAAEPYVGVLYTLVVFAALTFVLNKRWNAVAEAALAQTQSNLAAKP